MSTIDQDYPHLPIALELAPPDCRQDEYTTVVFAAGIPADQFTVLEAVVPLLQVFTPNSVKGLIQWMADNDLESAVVSTHDRKNVTLHREDLSLFLMMGYANQQDTIVSDLVRLNPAHA